MRSFGYADILRVVGTYSEVHTVFLLAGMLNVSTGMTQGVRGFPKFDSNCLEISAVLLLAGVPLIMMGGIDESGNILSAIPCTWMYLK